MAPGIIGRHPLLHSSGSDLTTMALNLAGEKRHGSHHQFITAGGSNNRPKFTTRHLAALGFLSNIPMAKEASIREAGMNNISRIIAMEDGNGHNNDEESVDEDDAMGGNSGADQKDEFMMLQTDSAGIKLRGPAAPTARFPPQFRYYFQHVSDQNAVVRQWEDQLLGKGNSPASTGAHPLLNSRVFCSRSRSYPCMVFSVIKYDAGEEKAKIQKLIAEDHKGLEVFDLPRRDWRGFSYKPLFKTIVEEKSGDHFFEKGYLYDPDMLDDPNLLHGAHRYVLQRKAATGPIISSIIHFVNKQELKESLNEKFREKHPSLPPSLTLSKIRNLKKETLLTCLSIGIEISTVAIAMINFERLCMKSLVTKYNRRLSMAVSLLLAMKFNETVHVNYHTMLNALLSFFDREWDLPKKQIFEAEFGAFVHLGFTLQLPFHHVYLMYSRLLKLLNETSKHYLGETMHDIYVQDVIAQERQREQSRNAQRERDKESREQAAQVQQARLRAASMESSNSESVRRAPRKQSRATSSSAAAQLAATQASTRKASVASAGASSVPITTNTASTTAAFIAAGTEDKVAVPVVEEAAVEGRHEPLPHKKSGMMDKFPFL